MSYISKIFNKSILDLKLIDVKSFFETPQEETSVLEFKSGEVEINDIFKEVTAFLNTEGGLIIIGTPRETRVKDGKKESTFCCGDITYSKFRNKDWLSQKISSNIVPTPIGIKIFEHCDNSGSIFIIDIPQSQTPPHQCSTDGKYYIRLEREAKPAPHGIIQALFQKRRIPILKANINIELESSIYDSITVYIRNESDFPADKVSFIISVYNVHNVKDSKNNFNITSDNSGDVYVYNQNLDHVLVQIISVPIHFLIEHKNSEYIIFVGYWCLNSDFNFQYWTYNPMKNSIVRTDELDFKEVSFQDELKRITS